MKTLEGDKRHKMASEDPPGHTRDDIDMRTFNHIDWSSCPSYNLRLKQFILILFFFLLFTSCIGKRIFNWDIVCKWYIRLNYISLFSNKYANQKIPSAQKFLNAPRRLRPIFPLSIKTIFLWFPLSFVRCGVYVVKKTCVIKSHQIKEDLSVIYFQGQERMIIILPDAYLAPSIGPCCALTWFPCSCWTWRTFSNSSLTVQCVIFKCYCPAESFSEFWLEELQIFF